MVEWNFSGLEKIISKSMGILVPPAVKVTRYNFVGEMLVQTFSTFSSFI